MYYNVFFLIFRKENNFPKSVVLLQTYKKYFIFAFNIVFLPLNFSAILLPLDMKLLSTLLFKKTFLQTFLSPSAFSVSDKYSHLFQISKIFQIKVWDMFSSNLEKSPISIKYFVLCSPVTSINQGSFSFFKLFDTAH